MDTVSLFLVFVFPRRPVLWFLNALMTSTPQKWVRALCVRLSLQPHQLRKNRTWLPVDWYLSPAKACYLTWLTSGPFAVSPSPLLSRAEELSAPQEINCTTNVLFPHPGKRWSQRHKSNPRGSAAGLLSSFVLLVLCSALITFSLLFYSYSITWNCLSSGFSMSMQPFCLKITE